MKAVIDTNILIYDTFEDSLYHEDASRLLDRLDKWVIPTIVFYEYIWFMKGLKVNLLDIVDKVLEYTGSPKTIIVSEDKWGIEWALQRISREKISLSRFNDKVILSSAVRRRLPLATYDDKLREQAGNQGVKVLP